MTSTTPPLFFFFDSLKASKKQFLSLRQFRWIYLRLTFFSPPAPPFLLTSWPCDSLRLLFSSSFFLSSLYSFHESLFPYFLGPEIRDTSDLLFLLLLVNFSFSPMFLMNTQPSTSKLPAWTYSTVLHGRSGHILLSSHCLFFHRHGYTFLALFSVPSSPSLSSRI